MVTIKTLAAPRTWPIGRKAHKYIIKPHPGKDMNFSIPITFALKLLGLAKTGREARYILNNKIINVNNKRIKEEKFNVGFMDIIYVPGIDKSYRLLINKNNKLYFKETPNNSNLILKVMNKRLLKKSRWQLNMFNGYNLLLDDENLLDRIKNNDSVVLDLENNKIVDVLKFENGSFAYIILGKNIGHGGEITSIDKDIIEINTPEGIFKTNKKNIYIIGKNKPLVEL